jgi:hypothetical protein
MVDIDTGMKLEDLLEHWFYQLYGAGFYTTASHTEANPRFRIIYVLDEPITDKQRMRQLYEGLLSIHGAADTSCKDICRLFYGAIKPEYAAISSKTLPDYGVDLAISQRKTKRDEMKVYTELTVTSDTQADLLRTLDDLKAARPKLPYGDRFVVANTVGGYMSKTEAIAEMRKRWPDAESTGKYEDILKNHGRYSNTPRTATLVHMIRAVNKDYRKKVEETPKTYWEMKKYLRQALHMPN